VFTYRCFTLLDSATRLGIDPEYHSTVVLSIQMGSGDYLADRVIIHKILHSSFLISSMPVSFFALQRIPQVKAIHPKAKGTQDQEVRSGVGEQMENIARQFLERVWPSLHADSKDKPVAKLKALTGYDGELDLYLLLPRNPHSQFKTTNLPTENTCYLAWEKLNYDFEAASAWLIDSADDKTGKASSPAPAVKSPPAKKGKTKVIPCDCENQLNIF